MTATTQKSPAQPDRDLLLTMPEACHQLRISRWMLYRLIQSGQLRTIRIGSRRFVRPSAVKALVENLSHNNEGA